MSEEKKSNATVVIALAGNAERIARFYGVQGISTTDGMLLLYDDEDAADPQPIAAFAPGSWRRYFLDDSAAEPRLLGT